MKKYIRKLAVAGVAVAAVIGALVGFKVSTDPYTGSLLKRTHDGVVYRTDDIYSDPLKEFTSEEALEDLEYAYKCFKKVHPITYKGVPEECEQRYEEAKAKVLAADTLSTNQICALVESFLSPIGDGHSHATTVTYDAHYMVHHIPEDVVEILAVNGESYEEIFERNSLKFSYETYSAGLRKCLAYSKSLEGLDYLEIDTTKPVVYTVLLENGNSVDITVPIEGFLLDSENEYREQEEEATEKPFVYYEIYDDLSLAVLTLDSCVANSFYKDTLKAMFTEVKEKDIRNVCVDLRENGGGSSVVLNLFLQYCDVDEYKGWSSVVRKIWYVKKHEQSVKKNRKKADLLFDGSLYLLTSEETYSAAKDFAMVVKDNNIGTLIGKASGNNPNSYGDCVYFLLPNSNVLLSLSYKKWYRTDYKEGFIEPDIECEADAALDVLVDIINSKAR